ncbi:hypothetical protein L571_1151 [Bordetella pertussis 2371640]|nr:hypothetical protein L571_1151 [Bordetella pertussis 2371640]
MRPRGSPVRREVGLIGINNRIVRDSPVRAPRRSTGPARKARRRLAQRRRHLLAQGALGQQPISSFSNPVRMNHAYNLLNLHS